MKYESISRAIEAKSPEKKLRDIELGVMALNALFEDGIPKECMNFTIGDLTNYLNERYSPIHVLNMDISIDQALIERLV